VESGVPKTGYVQLRCKFCDGYFMTSQRKRRVKCGRCLRENYVPKFAEWEGTGTPEAIALSVRAGRPVVCVRCGHVWRSTQVTGSPTHCGQCKAGIRIREVADGPSGGPPDKINQAAGGTRGARVTRTRKTRPRKDVTPGSAAAIGRDNARELRRERTTEQRTERATERATNQESISAGAQGMSAIADSMRQLAAMMGRQLPPSPHSPTVAAPTRVSAPPEPRLFGVCVPATRPDTTRKRRVLARIAGDPSTCWGITESGRRCGAPVTQKVDGLPYCNAHNGYRWTSR